MQQPLWHAMSGDAGLKELETDPLNGLTPDEARRCLERVGPNELKHETAVSPITIFIHQFKNILIVILIVAVVTRQIGQREARTPTPKAIRAASPTSPLPVSRPWPRGSKGEWVSSPSRSPNASSTTWW